MCITKTEAWAYAGVNYTTEKEAVKAALTDIGSRLIKEFHGNPLQGLLTLGAEVSELRDRYLDLLDQELQAEKGIPEKPEGTQEDPSVVMPHKNRRLAMRKQLDEMESTHPIKRAVQTFMEREGYATPRAFWTRANAPQFDELERILDQGEKP